MRRENIVEIIANTSVAVGLAAITLFGIPAHADTSLQRMQAELNRGRDYAAAWAEASRATGPLYAPVAADANKVQSALMQGKDYVEGWAAASRSTETVFSPKQVAKAQKAKEELNVGKDYITAWEAPINEQPPARVQAASKGSGAGTRGRTGPEGSE